MRNLYYEIADNGYCIRDFNDKFFNIQQYEPYIPNRDKSYEENAQLQIYELMVELYVVNVYYGKMNIANVPEEYYKQVSAAVDYLKSIEETNLSETEEKAIAYDILMGVRE